MTVVLTAPAERRTGLDVSWPILIAFAAILVALIVLPMSWLVYFSLTDKGTFTLANFAKLVTDPTFLDPLVTTVILATSSAIICCAVAAPMGWLVARHATPLVGCRPRHAAAPHDPRTGDGVVRDAAVPRRDRVGTARRAELRAAQPA